MIMNDIYNLEIERIVNKIKKHKSARVLIQLPEGLKPQATKICDEIEKKTGAKCLIWLDTCYGACDIPKVDNDIDLLVQFGHSEFGF